MTFCVLEKKHTVQAGKVYLTLWLGPRHDLSRQVENWMWNRHEGIKECDIIATKTSLASRKRRKQSHSTGINTGKTAKPLGQCKLQTPKNLYWPKSLLFSVLIDCYQPALLDNIDVSLLTFKNKQNIFYCQAYSGLTAAWPTWWSASQDSITQNKIVVYGFKRTRKKL